MHGWREQTTRVVSGDNAIDAPQSRKSGPIALGLQLTSFPIVLEYREYLPRRHAHAILGSLRDVEKAVRSYHGCFLQHLRCGVTSSSETTVTLSNPHLFCA